MAKHRRKLLIVALAVLSVLVIAAGVACDDVGDSKNPNSGKDTGRVELVAFNIIPNGFDAAAEYDVVCLDKNRTGVLDLFTIELVFSNIASNPILSFTMSGNTFTADDFAKDSTPSRIRVRNQSINETEEGETVLEVTEVVYNNSKGTVRLKPSAYNTRKILFDPDFNLTVNYGESSYEEEDASRTINYGSIMGLPTDDKMNREYGVEGKIFAGWYTEPDGKGDKVEGSDSYYYPFDISLYAYYDVPYRYTVNENAGTVSITGLKDEYKSTTLLITIPESIEGYPVTEIADRAFSSVGNNKRFMLPYSVKRIGEYAFYNCDNLNIYMPGVERIEKAAFQYPSGGGSLSFSVLTPKGVTTESMLPSGLKYIGDYAFSGNSMDCNPNSYEAGSSPTISQTLRDTLLLPTSVEQIGKEAFQASGLKNVYFPEGSPLRPAGDALPEEVSGDGSDVGFDFEDYFIGEGVFRDSVKLETVYTSYTLSGGDVVESNEPGLGVISDYMFYNCKALKQVELAEGLRLIGALAFASDSAHKMVDLNGVSFPNSLEVLGQQAFANAGLTTVTFKENSEFKTLGDWAFSQTNITSVTFYSLRTYGKAPFWGNNSISEVRILSDNIADIRVPDKVSDLGDTAGTQVRYRVPIAVLSDYRSKWGKVYSNSDSTGIFDSYKLQIEEIILADEYVNKDAGYAFEPVDEGGALKADGITDYAKVTYLYGKPESFEIDDTVEITIDGTVRNYTVTDIGGYLTHDTTVTSAAISDTVKKVTLPTTVKRIDDYAFYKMSKLESIAWRTPGGAQEISAYDDAIQLVSIGEYAFRETALENFTSSPNLQLIGGEAFTYSALTRVDLTKCTSLTIGKSAFSNNKIENLTLGSGVAGLQGYCFAYQTGNPMTITFLGAPPKVDTSLDPFFNVEIAGNKVLVPSAYINDYNNRDKINIPTLSGKYVTSL